MSEVLGVFWSTFRCLIQANHRLSEVLGVFRPTLRCLIGVPPPPPHPFARPPRPIMERCHGISVIASPGGPVGGPHHLQPLPTPHSSRQSVRQSPPRGDLSPQPISLCWPAGLHTARASRMGRTLKGVGQCYTETIPIDWAANDRGAKDQEAKVLSPLTGHTHSLSELPALNVVFVETWNFTCD